MKRVAVVQPGREPPILVCRKCLKRSADGRKIRRKLKRELGSAGNGTRKAPRLIPTGCFKLCPERAVVLASGASLAQGKYVLISRHEDTKSALDLLNAPDAT
jgi:hypothetical protein